MKPPRWIWKLNPAGTIAVANLACFGLCGLLQMSLVPDGVLHVDQEPASKVAIVESLRFIMAQLAFPVGWISLFLCPMGVPWAAVIFVPINAYFWGSMGQATWCRRQEISGWLPKLSDHTARRCPNPDCLRQSHLDLSRCPACKTPLPKESIPPRGNGAQLTIARVFVAGVVAPVLFGSLVTAVFTFWEPFVSIAAIVAGAGFVLAIVRFVNRHDSRRGRKVASAIQPDEPRR
jgi:hypothetical protein